MNRILSTFSILSAYTLAYEDEQQAAEVDEQDQDPALLEPVTGKRPIWCINYLSVNAMMIFIDYHRRGLPVLIMLIMFWEYSTSMLRLYLTLINCLGLDSS